MKFFPSFGNSTPYFKLPCEVVPKHILDCAYTKEDNEINKYINILIKIPFCMLTFVLAASFC